MSDDQGRIIARRSISLSKTYPIAGLALVLLGLLIAGLSGVVGNVSPGLPVNETGSRIANISSALPLVAVALQAFAAITFATPVLLLYVYDKNNGMLEYFLSLGMNQGDIYRQYLKAALTLSSILVAFVIFMDVVVGAIEGLRASLLGEMCGLVVALALPAVSLGTMVMMSFSSLQKQRVGSNQPLGMAIGVFMVLPAYLSPLVFPALALEIDLVLAGLIGCLALVVYLSSSRLISREKLLP